MLELRDIFKTYDNQPLLRGISFSLDQGETVCLLGASGSGKSTLLRMIAGLEFPERGQIFFNGADLAQTPTHLRDFGLVFQDYGLFPHLNIFDNVAFGLKMKGIAEKEINGRVREMLELVNLQGFEKRNIADLSGGEQQRVALARALAPRPRLLMFDEPLGALDRNLKESLLQEIRAILHEMKIPAIYVTHDQDEAFALADRILLLHDGEIVRAGAPAEVWADPGSVWVAQFLDVGNIVEGKIQNVERGRINVETAFGMFAVDCDHEHAAGDKIPLLVRQSEEEGQEINLKVEDVLFKRDQFEARGMGLAFLIHQAPVVGQIIKVKVQLQCLK